MRIGADDLHGPRTGLCGLVLASAGDVGWPEGRGRVGSGRTGRRSRPAGRPACPADKEGATSRLARRPHDMERHMTKESPWISD